MAFSVWQMVKRGLPTPMKTTPPLVPTPKPPFPTPLPSPHNSFLFGEVMIAIAIAIAPFTLAAPIYLVKDGRRNAFLPNPCAKARMGETAPK
jgi:hypothetical protein